MSYKNILNLLLVLFVLAMFSLSAITVIPDSSAVNIRDILTWVILAFTTLFVILRILLARKLMKDPNYETKIPRPALVVFQVFAAVYAVFATLIFAA